MCLKEVFQENLKVLEPKVSCIVREALLKSYFAEFCFIDIIHCEIIKIT